MSMDGWRNGLRRALGESIGPTPIGFDDVLNASRRIDKFNRLSTLLQGLDAMAAAKKGVGPAELAAIRAMRMSEIPPRRLDELCATLLDAPA